MTFQPSLHQQEESTKMSKNLDVLCVKTADCEQHLLTSDQVKCIGMLNEMYNDINEQQKLRRDPIVLQTIYNREMTTILEWISLHHYSFPTTTTSRYEGESQPNDLTRKDEEFVWRLPKNAIFPLMIACHYLNVKSLLDCCCKVLAGVLRRMTVDQARDELGIHTDFTPEEDARIASENAWAEDLESDQRTYI